MSRIPKTTLKRLALYHRCFLELKSNGIIKIQSSELSTKMGIEPATIRKDFSHLGELGRQGYGYKVDFVLDAFEKFFQIQGEERQKSVIIGVGNLGRALINFFTSNRFANISTHAPTELVAAFDANHEIAGSTINNIPIFHIESLVNFIEENDIKYVILAVPAHSGQQVVDLVKDTDVHGVLNLTSTIINAGNIVVHEVDLGLELTTLIFTSIQEQAAKDETTIKDILQI